jgi:hypothetical protein
MIRMVNMKFLMKNKWMAIGVGAVLIVVLVAGFMFVAQRNVSKAPGVEQTPEEQAIEMSPEDIGLELTPNAANTEVKMRIRDVSKFNSFEYEMNYDAIVDGEVVPRGAIGSGDVNPGETSIERAITIGTCSAGKCKYDKGVTKISFIIRLNLKDGTTGVVKKDLNLEE